MSLLLHYNIITDAAVPSHSEDFAVEENSVYAIAQPAFPVAPRYIRICDEFVMKENSAYGLAQSSVPHDNLQYHMNMKTL